MSLQPAKMSQDYGKIYPFSKTSQRDKSGMLFAYLRTLEAQMHWYVVANQREAKIYIKTPQRKQLKLLNSLVNPLGMEKRRDLIKREAGRGVKSLGRAGAVSFSKSDQYNPQEDAIAQFARQITQFLRNEKLKNSFQSMTLVAEPHLLGMIKAKMSSVLKNSTTHWIKKDLQKKPQNELARFLLPAKTFVSPPVAS